MVVVVGLFYQRSDRLESADAYVRAAELVARTYKSTGHVALNLVNENNSNQWRGCPFPVQNAEALARLAAAAKAAAPDVLVGGGGYHPETNLTLARDPRIDVLWYDDQEFVETMPRYLNQGLSRPHVNVETFGRAAAGFVTLANGMDVNGVWPEQGHTDRPKVRGKVEFRAAVQAAAATPGFYVFGHLQAWFQAKSGDVDRNRYDVGGAGTLDDPGIRWYLEAVARARGYL